MGVDAEGVADGDEACPELFVTNFANEYNTLYINYGKGIFFDHTAFFGLASDTMPWVGWGSSLSDFDNDGWPDCFTVNGHVDNNRKLLGQPVEYEEIPLLFRNDKGKRFRLATRDAGPYFDTKLRRRQRHLASATSTTTATSTSWRTTRTSAGTPAQRHEVEATTSIRFVLQGTRSNRDAVGAQLEITIEDRLENPPKERTINRQRKGGCSLQGTNDPRVLVGIGPTDRVKRAVIQWPSGIVTTMEDLGGRPRLQARRAEGWQTRAAPTQAREESRERSGDSRPALEPGGRQ